MRLAIDYIHTLENEQTIGHSNWSKTKSEKTNNTITTTIAVAAACVAVNRIYPESMIVCSLINYLNEKNELIFIRFF